MAENEIERVYAHVAAVNSFVYRPIIIIIIARHVIILADAGADAMMEYIANISKVVLKYKN